MYDGGYLMNEFPRQPLVKDRIGKTRQAVLNHWDAMPDVKGAVEAVSRTGWRINRAVLETAQAIWGRGFEVGKMPPLEEPERPRCPICGGVAGDKADKHPCFIDNEALLKDWKRKAAAHYDRVNGLRTKRIQAAKILSLAEKFADEPAIYFPHQLDFRGRLYPIPLFLQPQGNDLAKGVLTFAKGKPIDNDEAMDWLAIHGANVFGYDKVSLEERVEWVAEHEKAHHVRRPGPAGRGYGWWSDRDKPWQFLAFCYEWAGLLEHGVGFVSTLPVAVDGACNGLQHFSAMLRDPEGGAAVNLVPSDKPADIYQQVADIVTRKLCLEVSTRSCDASMAQQWLDYGVTRKLTKRPVMVVPYSGTQFTCREYVHEHIREVRDGGNLCPGRLTRSSRPPCYVTKLIWETIHEVVSSARLAMDWLRRCARKTTSEGKTLYWKTPTGFPVEQGYPKLLIQRVLLKSGEEFSLSPGCKPRRRVRSTLTTSSTASARTSSTPWTPLPSSSRSSGRSTTASRSSPWSTTATAARPPTPRTFGACLREAFVEMYQEHDVLAEFKASVEDHTGMEMPDPPAMGSLDLEQVTSSAFFFA